MSCQAKPARIASRTKTMRTVPIVDFDMRRKMAAIKNASLALKRLAAALGAASRHGKRGKGSNDSAQAGGWKLEDARHRAPISARSPPSRWRRRPPAATSPCACRRHYRARRPGRAWLCHRRAGCHAADKGAHTGDISAAMLKDAGASLTIVGHSERREAHGETNADVRAKAEAALSAGLGVILCVGESLEVRDRGRRSPRRRAQLDASLPHVDDTARWRRLRADLGDRHRQGRRRPPTSPKCMRRCAQRLVAAYGEAGDASAFSTAARSRPRTPPKSSPLPTSTAPWSAAPASRRPTSCRSSRPPRIESRRRGPPRCARNSSFCRKPRMFTFLLIVQTLIAASLVVVILMQRSEGGGLGVGGSLVGLHDRPRRRRLPDPVDGGPRRVVRRPLDRRSPLMPVRPASRPRSTRRWPTSRRRRAGHRAGDRAGPPRRPGGAAGNQTAPAGTVGPAVPLAQ